MDPSSTMIKFQCLNEAYRLNNAGVDYVATGDFQSGMHSLTGALSILNQYVYDHDNDDFNVRSSTITTTAKNGPNADGAQKCAALATRPMKAEAAAAASGSCNSFFVCQKALVFAEPPTISSNIGVASAVVLFNVGLVFHQLGLMGTTKLCQARLQKALHMYRECANLATAMLAPLLPNNNCDQANINDHDGAEQAMLLQMIIVARNNQASIVYLHQADFNAATQLLDEDVRQSYNQLCTMMVAPVNINEAIIFDRSDIEEIILNVATLSRPPTGAPCA